MSNLLKRTVPVILVLAICITCLVSPASAAVFEVENTMYNYFDYSDASPYCILRRPTAAGAVTNGS